MIRVDVETVPFLGDFEIVERKGTGHPDTICDSLAEEYSRAISRFYAERFGKILHHNLDKAILIGGEATPRFGGGEVKLPIEFTLVGRATYRYKGVDVRSELEDIFYETVRNWVENNLSHLDVNRHIKFRLKARMGSDDLIDLFERESGAPLANDTSFGVGFYPFTKAERLAYVIERYLNSKEYKRENPYVGEDIKVMVVREMDTYRVTVALAFVDRYIESVKKYKEFKSKVQNDVFIKAKEIIGDLPLSVEINVADDYSRNSVYITVTGTSAEAGDDGQVGRGNRVNGLITPYRPMTLEAAAGKNPVSHVGKIYNVAANMIAKELVERFPVVDQAYVYLVSQIGRPINDPQLVHVKVWGDPSQEDLEDIKDYSLERMKQLSTLWKDIVFESIEVV